MNCLLISLFGRFSASLDNTLINIEANKLQELLSYLLLYRDRPHHRERLAGLFWDANSTAQSKKYLRQALWQLHQNLEKCYGDRAGLLRMDGDWVFINHNVELWLDIREFETAYNSVREVLGHEMSAEVSANLKQAVHLYKGDLLEGWYQDWCHFERERFQIIYLSMLDKLMSYCATQGEYEEGIYYANLGLRQDRAQERTHQQLMRLHYLSGNRSAALRQFQTCTELLRSELNVGPSNLTRLIYAQIQGDHLAVEDETAQPQNRGNTQIVLRMLSNQLRQLQNEIDQIQHQVESHLDSAVQL